MPEQLVKDSEARRELGGLSAMTFWRWDHDPARAPKGWEPRFEFGSRNFRKRSVLEAVKASVRTCEAA